MKYKHWMIVLAVTIIGVGLANAFKWYTLEDWSYWAQIVTALSVAFGAAAFYHQVKEDRTKRIFSLVEEYNDRIFPQLQELTDEISKEPGLAQILVGKIPIMTLSAFMKSFKDRWMAEYKFFSIEIAKEGRKELRAKLWSLLIQMEVLSAKILHSKVHENVGTTQHNALAVIKDNFVEAVERFPMTILTMAANEGSPYFKEIVTLYEKWKGNAIRTPDWERIFKAEVAKYQSASR